VLRRHWPFALVLAAGAALRLACEIAYRPALFYSDSWGYLSMAHGSGIVSFAPLRPSGYPLVLKILSVVGNGLAATTLVQHLAGLATATLAYVTCRALGVRRWLATAAGALVALDAWAIALEQYVLAEAFFALLLAACVWASLVARKSSMDVALAVAGLCLAGAALMRPVALFAAVAWLVWLVWTRPGRRPLVAGFAALVVPLLVYSLAHQSVTGTFGLTQAEGWFLYGRVGSIAKCDGIDVARDARKLCARPQRADHEGQSFFMFNRASPARRAFGGISADSKRQARTNGILRHFAVQVIEKHPGAYAKLVGGDFLRFFRPGPHARYREDATVEFPARARIRFDDRPTRHRLFPGLHGHASAPAGVLRAYGKVFHTSRPLVALMTLISLIGLGLGLRRRDPRAHAIFLPLGMALLTLLGAAATASFALRYLVPVVAPFTIAATLAIELLTDAAAERRARPRS
jgi:4-amino-4-deoxy-L-arabinose transferase-like glycosyltransferase